MCTGVEWILRCSRCENVILKDHHAVKGYTCREARKNKGRGVCRTGIEWRQYEPKFGCDKVDVGELCILCEMEPLVDVLSAETCPEASEEPPAVAFDEDDEDDEDGGASLHEGH